MTMLPYPFVSAVRNNYGIALFIVLWVVVLLSVIVGEFCYTARTEAKITRNFKENTEAYYIALAGVSRAIEGLVHAEIFNDEINQAEDASEGFSGESQEIDWRVNTEIPPIKVGAGEAAVRIENESGRVNINEVGQSLLKALLSGFDLDQKQVEIIVDSIMDWRDKNDLHRLNGAEDDYYQSLPEPYECKDAPFDSVDELLLVRGVTKDIYYNGLSEVVTVIGQAQEAENPASNLIIRNRSQLNLRNTSRARSSGDTFDFNKININAASEQLLGMMPGVTDEDARIIAEYRKEEDFRAYSQLSNLISSQAYTELRKFITFDMLPYYTIIGVGQLPHSGVKEGLRVQIKLEPQKEEKYRVVQWQDQLQKVF